MATDAIVPGADDTGPDEEDREKLPSRGDGGGGPRSGGPAPRQQAPKVGFFTIYKSGQGYWTRLCTAGGALLFLVFLIGFLWQNLPPWIRPALTPENATGIQQQNAQTTAQKITMGVCAAIAIGTALLAWRIMNKPDNVDFLVATDSEMKKVNWTSKKELIGSTKVVIFFMFIIAGVLFLIDLDFGDLFHHVSVLTGSPVPEADPSQAGSGQYAHVFHWFFWGLQAVATAVLCALVGWRKSEKR